MEAATTAINRVNLDLYYLPEVKNVNRTEIKVLHLKIAK